MEEILQVDKVLCINLDHRIDRWNSAREQIFNAGFSPNVVERFSAVKGKDLNLHELNIVSTRAIHDLQHPRDNHFSIATKGAIGCYLSHYNIWKKMCDENISSVLIFEDDILIDPHFHKRAKHIFHQLREQDWLDDGVIFLHSHTFPGYDALEPTEIPGIFRNKDVFFSAAAYRMTLPAARKLVQHAFPIEMQVDIYVAMFGADRSNNFRNLIIRPELIKTRASFDTDIQTICWKCDLPNNGTFYFGFFVFLAILVVLVLWCFVKHQILHK